MHKRRSRLIRQIRLWYIKDDVEFLVKIHPEVPFSSYHRNQLKNSQIAIAMSPGHCRTDMGK
jgi:hypothetical protein